MKQSTKLMSPSWLLCLGLVFLSTLTTGAPVAKGGRKRGPQRRGPQWAMEMSCHMAASEVSRRGNTLNYKQFDPERNRTAKWDYTSGFFALSLYELQRAVSSSPRGAGIRRQCANSESFGNFAATYIKSYVQENGTIATYEKDKYTLDNVLSGRPLLITSDRDEASRGSLLKAAADLRSQLDSQPRVQPEGGFWHKKIYHSQMWLDGLYMAGPFYAESERRFNHSGMIDDVVKQFRVIAEHTYDPSTGLFYHGWDQSGKESWAKNGTGTNSAFWGRAMGWFAMGLVDTLDYIPGDRRDLVEEMRCIFRKLVGGILRYQDRSSGVWYQVVDQGAREGNYLESSASSMFVYALAKGVNKGHVSARQCRHAAINGYVGLIKTFIRGGPQSGSVSLTRVCQVAGLGNGRNGTFEYYVNEPIVSNDLKGVPAFILAGLEVAKLNLPITI